MERNTKNPDVIETFRDFACVLVAEGVTKYVTLALVLVTLFVDLGYLSPLLGRTRLYTRRYMKGAWRCTRPCTILIQRHYFKIAQ